MKLIKKISGLTGVLLLVPLMTLAASPLTVAELALHRIEKLVQLNRVEAAYISNFQNVSVEALTQANPNDPAFKTIVSQTDNAQVAPPRVNLLHKSDGKVLSHTIASGIAGAALTWPNKDPLTISEATLHYIEEHGQHQTPLLLFDVGFKDLTVSQETRNNVLVAIVNVTSNSSEQYAEFVISMDGVVQSWSLK